MSVLHRTRSGEGRHRVPSFEDVRETVRTGPAADFDWGCTLPPMTMAQIAAQEPAEWETEAAPMGNPIALIEHAWRVAVAPLEALLHDPLPDTDWLDVLAGAEASTIRMCSRAVEACQRILLGADIGHELRAPSGCCPECGDRFELDKGRIPSHYPTGGTGPCPGSGNEPEGSAR